MNILVNLYEDVRRVANNAIMQDFEAIGRDQLCQQKKVLSQVKPR